MRISDWSSDVCSSDLPLVERGDAILIHVETDDLETGIVHADRQWYSDIPQSDDSRSSRSGFALHCSPLFWRTARGPFTRSDAPRVGKQCVSPCSSRCPLYHYKKTLATRTNQTI